MRRTILIAGLLLCVSLGSSLVCAESTAYPDLVGTWTGVSSGYHAEDEMFYNETLDMMYTLTIAEQQGQALRGTMDISEEYYQANFTFSGIIDHDMTTIYLAEKGTGMDIIHILSPTEIDFIGLDLENGSSMVVHFIKEE